MPTFPSGVQTCQLAFGKGVTPIGTSQAAKLQVELVAGDLSAVVWEADGTPLLKLLDVVSTDVDTFGHVSLPFVDQAGWVDGSGAPYTMWAYKLTEIIGRFSRVKYVQPLVGQTELDFDLIPDGIVGLPVSAPVVPVTSVAGKSGAVVLDATDVGAVPNTSEGRQALAESEELAVTFASVIGVTPKGNATADVAAINAAIALAATSGGWVRLQGSPFGLTSFQQNAKISLPGSKGIGFSMDCGISMTATAAMTAMIEKPAGGPANGLYIGRLDLDCNRLAERGVEVEESTLGRMGDFMIKNFTDCGVELGRQGGLVLEMTWDGFSRLIGIDENRSGAVASQMPPYGVKTKSTDSHFMNVVVKNTVKGFRDVNGANVWTACHVFGYPVKGHGTADPLKDFTTEVGFELIGGLTRLVNCHPDTAIIGVWNEGQQNQVSGSLHFYPPNFSRTETITPYHVEKGQLDVYGGAARLPNFKLDGTTPSPLTGVMGSLRKEGAGQTPTSLRFHGTSFYGNAWAQKNLLDSASASQIKFLDVYWSGGAVPHELDLQGGVLSAGTGSGITGAAGTSRDLVFKTAGNNRWVIRTDNGAESGGNSGSALQVNAQKDDGTFLFNVFNVQRYNGVFVHQRATLDPVNTQTISADAAVTIDAALSNDHIIYLDANVTSSTIGMASSTGSTTIQNGHKLAISVIQGAAGGKTFAWPSNCRFASNAAPGNPNIGRMATVHFRYRSGFWLEVARTIDVPTA